MLPLIYITITYIFISNIYMYIYKVKCSIYFVQMMSDSQYSQALGYPVIPWKQNLRPVYYLVQPEIHYRDKHFREVLPCKIRGKRFVPFLLHAQCPGRPFWLAAKSTQIRADHTSLSFMIHCTCFTLLPSVLLLLLGALSLGS